jgi:dTMP kinase
MKKNPYPGKFIVIEGLDGSGKTTQIKYLGKFLRGKGIKVLLTKEPTKDNVFGKKVDDVLHHRTKIDPFQLQVLFTKDRGWNLKHIVEPALKAGKIVVCDRYFFSTFAFGGIDLNMERLIKLNDKFILPDLTIFVDVSPKECMRRILDREKESQTAFFEKEKKLEKVYKNYKKLSKRFNIRFINGERKINEIAKDVQKAVKL